MADVNITIGAQFDQLTAGIQSATNQISELKNAVVTLLAAGGLVAFIDKMAELGEQTERSAAILGVSTEAAQAFGVVADISGSSLEEVTTQLTRMQVGMERGQIQTSLQGRALAALGISAKQFIETSVDKQFNMLADAVKRLNDQGQNAAPALAMISRGLAQMYPELVQGSQHMEELRQRAVETGGVVSNQTTKAMVDLHTELVLLWDSLKGLGETIVAAFNPYLVEMASALSRSAGALSALIATGKLGSYLWDVGATALEKLTAEMNHNNEAIEAANKKEEALGQTLKGVVEQYQNMIKAAIDSATKTPTRINPGPDRDAIRQVDDAFKEQEVIINELAKTFQITELQKTQLLLVELKHRRDAEIEHGEAVRTANAKFNLDSTKATTQLTQTLMQDWKTAADTIAGAFNSQLHGLLAGTTTFAQAMKNMFASLIETIIAGFIKMGVEWAAQQIFMATVGRGIAAAASASAVSKLTSDAALVFGGVYANLAPVMGPAAAGPAAISQASVLADLPQVAQFELGTPFVPQTGLAMLHQGEAVIPASQNTNAGGSGAGSITLNINAIDGRSVANMFMSNKAVMNAVITALARENSGQFSRMAASL